MARRASLIQRVRAVHTDRSDWVAFVYYAISGTTMHKFRQYYVAGDLVRPQQFFAETARWTFWPSLALRGGILVFGKPLLALFGVGFEAGYNAMLILTCSRARWSAQRSGCLICSATANPAR
jgi:O-antigen/teichoic acid export membrane protein